MQLRSIAILFCSATLILADPVITPRQKYTINGKVPVLCMTFDDADFKDSSPAGNDGTPSGDVASATGISSGAMMFDGDGDYVTTTGAYSGVDGSDNFTVSTWVKSEITGTDQYILNTIKSATDKGFYLRYTSDNKIRVLVIGSGVSAYYDSDATINDGEWHNIILNYNLGTTFNPILYVDGIESSMTVGSDSGNVHISPMTNPLEIGARNLGTVSPFNGSIDEVIIYNKSLTSSEVKILYNIGKAGVR